MELVGYEDDETRIPPSFSSWVVHARYVGCNLVVPEYYNFSWVELCNKGIDILKQLRDE